MCYGRECALQIIIIIILVSICIGFSIRFFLLKKEILRIALHLKQLHSENTNALLGSSEKGLQELVIEINKVLKRNKQNEVISYRAQKSFKEAVTNVSHDLRTPLTSVKGYVQMIRSNTTSEEKKQEYLEVVEKRLDYLQKMIEVLFDFTRIESGDYVFNIEKINVNDMLADVFAMYYEDFHTRKITPTIHMPSSSLCINGDRKALERIFQNLIGNAITHGKGDITVSLFVENNHIEIVFENIADDMTQQDTERIFERFYKLDKSRASATTGLGLALVKEFVEKMNGSITATYTDNKIKIRLLFLVYGGE